MHTESSGAGDRRPSRLRSIIGGSIGNLVEWYDWYAYSAFSLYFAKSFFPPANQTVQLLNAAAVFAVGFFMRPLGGWVMGRYADRHGRKAALTLSVLLMCAGSLLIAITPSYASIGLLAPTVLVLARLLQGLSVGGEYGASATYLSEMAGQRHRGFWSSFQYVTLIAGQLIALGVLLLLQRILTHEQLLAWGWRIPFVIGACCAVVAVLMRRSLEETEDYQRDAATRPATSAAASIRGLLQHPRAVLTVVGLTAGGTVAFYTFTTYAQKFLVNTVGFTAQQATFINAVTLAVYVCLQPIVGAISDRIGRRPVLTTFAVLGTLGTVPLLTTLEHTTSVGGAIGLLLLALTAVSGYTAINAVVKAELFPTSIRALGVGLPYAITVSLFGGTAEYVALWFKSIGHEQWFYWYVTACIAGSLVVYVTMKESSKIGYMSE
ncbi:MAG TPA: MFS transporter [Gemmatimonas aurantiaca]|uniref:Alpha-ketoglutarate permease n=2 Tax=Gemmatimonas aurantiaca TaxID=173480 RepID=C1A7Q4_GEMAT|nr:MFS transporter [Gemmatimonas aurantiaca]BAH38264.1 alpha-ketoglutarate permease [Gemmatimonas aurantiaca T-27]HCT57036.1 MFS transporter [Gemmatimonas aurantiaca]